MTPPVDDPEALRRILANTEALLLDFDGPICSVFAGIPAPVVADQLRAVLAEGGYIDLPGDIRIAADPFEVLLYAAKLGQEEARYVESAFRAHEVEAVQLAEPTPDVDVLISSWKAAGKLLAIVSNNSADAVKVYLDKVGLTTKIDCISSRVSSNVSLLKPSSHLIESAVRKLNISEHVCALVGDSLTDIEAAHAARVTSIGYVNKPGKNLILAAAEPAAMVTSLRYLISL